MFSFCLAATPSTDDDITVQQSRGRGATARTEEEIYDANENTAEAVASGSKFGWFQCRSSCAGGASDDAASSAEVIQGKLDEETNLTETDLKDAPQEGMIFIALEDLWPRAQDDPYDPRAPENVVPATRAQAVATSSKLLASQLAALSTSLRDRRRRGRVPCHIWMHYELLIADMKRRSHKIGLEDASRSTAQSSSSRFAGDDANECQPAGDTSSKPLHVRHRSCVELSHSRGDRVSACESKCSSQSLAQSESPVSPLKIKVMDDDQWIVTQTSWSSDCSSPRSKADPEQHESQHDASFHTSDSQPRPRVPSLRPSFSTPVLSPKRKVLQSTAQADVDSMCREAVVSFGDSPASTLRSRLPTSTDESPTCVHLLNPMTSSMLTKRRSLAQGESMLDLRAYAAAHERADKFRSNALSTTYEGDFDMANPQEAIDTVECAEKDCTCSSDVKRLSRHDGSQLRYRCAAGGESMLDVSASSDWSASVLSTTDSDNIGKDSDRDSDVSDNAKEFDSLSGYCREHSLAVELTAPALHCPL